MYKTVPLLLLSAFGFTACFDNNSDAYNEDYYGDKSYGEESYGDESYGDEGYGKQEYGNQEYGSQPSAASDQQGQPSGGSYASSQSSGGGVQIMDAGFGISNRTYTVVPAGYSIRGQQRTDPSTGVVADCHVEIIGPNGAKLIETVPVLLQGGGKRAMLAAAEQSIMQGLQRSGASGRRTGEWKDIAPPSSGGQGSNLSAAEAPFTTSTGMTGKMLVGYEVNQYGTGYGTPLVHFAKSGDGVCFRAGPRPDCSRSPR